MNKQELLFKRLKSIKDYWVNISEEGLQENADLIWSDFAGEYKLIGKKLDSEEAKEAYKKVIDEVIKGTIHSILVMIDGGDELADKFKIDLVSKQDSQSLREGGALHEEFFGYLLENE